MQISKEVEKMFNESRNCKEFVEKFSPNNKKWGRQVWNILNWRKKQEFK